MKIYTKIKPLLKFFNNRATMPILQTALCSFDETGNLIGLTCSNLTQSLIVGSQSSRSVCVQISDILRLEDAQAIKLDRNKVRAEGFEFTTIDQSEFPNALRFQQASAKQEIGRDSILSLMDFVCEDQTRFNLCGISFQPNGVFSTNNHAICRIGEVTTLSDSKIVPVEFFDLLTISKQEIFEISFDYVAECASSTFKTYLGTARIESRLIDGTFPAVSKCFDLKDQSNVIDLEPVSKQIQSFLKSLPKKHDEAVIFQSTDSKLELCFEINNPETKVKKSVVLDLAYSGIRFGINPIFLGNALGSGCLSFRTGKTYADPLTFKSANGNQSILIMPVRLKG